VSPDDLARLPPERIGLFLDVDGTILDFADHPDGVDMPDRLIEHMVRVERCLAGAFALVSGRPIESLDRLFTPVRFRASGVHGAEIRLSPEGPCERLTNCNLSRELWDGLAAVLTGFPGTFAEDKRVSFAVHYSADPHEEAELALALAAFLAQWRSTGRIEMIRSRRVLEIKLAGFDKGRAIDRFMAEAPFEGRIPVFIADDPADWPGFEAVLARGGIGYSVGRVMPGLSGSFCGPAAVRAWLGSIGR
jgi:trehalose 6-phosphate phosphatase